MIKANFYLQSILCGLAVALGVSSFIATDLVFWLMCLALVLGITQYLTSFTLMFIAGTPTSLSAWHFVLSTAYLFSVAFWAESIKIMAIAMPAGLAVLFWYVSFQMFKARRL